MQGETLSRELHLWIFLRAISLVNDDRFDELLYA